MMRIAEAIKYAWVKVTTNWIALVIFISCGVVMAIKGNPGFIIGVGIGLALCFCAALLYKLTR